MEKLFLVAKCRKEERMKQILETSASVQPVYDDIQPQARVAYENFGHSKGSNPQN